MSDEEKELKEYEVSFLTDAEEDAQEAMKILNAHRAVITFEGSIKKTDLAYALKKRNSAYFGYFHFQADPAELPAIEGDLRLNKKIIRLLILTPPIPAKGLAPSKRPIAVRAAAPKTVDRQSPELSNAELEEKLEEILK